MMTPREKEHLYSDIRECCRKLFLSSEIAELCEQQSTPKQAQFMLEALQKEVAIRDENKKQRLIKRAMFPILKTFANYDFSHVAMPSAMTKEELKSAGFVPKHQNLVLYGPVGTGKTHMAIAAGIAACRLGYKVRFFTVTELVLRLSEARKNGTLEKFRSELKAQDLLILDEWGYVPVDRDGSQLMFQIVSDSYESKSLILTTNLEFSKWGSVFTDDQMAAAMIDRLVHHGHLFMFDGKSYRMEHALMKQSVPKKTKSSC